MRPLALLVLPLTLTLAACGSRGVQAPDTYDLSGTIGGNWGTDARLRLALVGTGFPDVLINDGNQAQNVVSTGVNAWNFGFDLPDRPSLTSLFGAYQVVAYNDANNTGTYEIGETFARNKQWLIYSTISGNIPAVTLPGSGEEITPAMTVSAGWNLYDRNFPLSDTNPRPASKVTGYDISR